MLPRILWLVIFIASSAFSATGNDKSHFLIEAGGYCTNLNRRLEAETGYANKVSSIEGYLRVHPVFRLSNRFNLEPSLGALVPGLASADGTTRTFVFHIDLDLGLKLKDWWTLRMGPGLQWGWLNSKGAGVDLNNGTSSSTFYNPNQSISYFVLTTDAGLTFRLSQRFHLLFDLYVMDVASKLRRTFEVSATLGFRL